MTLHNQYESTQIYKNLFLLKPSSHKKENLNEEHTFNKWSGQ